MLDINLDKLLELANVANNYLKLRIQDTYVNSKVIKKELKEMEETLSSHGIKLDKFIGKLKNIHVVTFKQTDMNWDYKNEQYVATVYSEDGRCIAGANASFNSDYTLTYKLEDNEVVCEPVPVVKAPSLIRDHCDCGGKLTLIQNSLGEILQLEEDIKIKSKEYLVCSNPKCGFKGFNQFLALIDELRKNKCVLDTEGRNALGGQNSYDRYDELKTHRREIEVHMGDSVGLFEYLKSQGEYFKPNIDKERLGKVLETKLPERTLSRLKQVYNII